MLKSMTFRATLIAIACAISASAFAIADTPKQIDVPAGDLTVALQQLAKQSGVEFVYSAEQLKGVQTRGVQGKYTTEKAVTKLLEGTKLKLTIHESGALLISDLSAGSASPRDTTLRASAATEPNDPSPAGVTADNVAGEKGARLAQEESNRPTSASRSRDRKDSEAASGLQIEEIVVTARKRQERLQDVPVPVTAISGEALLNFNQLRLQDFYTTLPSLNVTPGGFGGSPVITIRGLNSGDGNPTSSILIDDVPFGGSTVLGGGLTLADLDPSEVAHVELLRGAQGTLYGANSIGGLIKYVTVDPSTERFSGHVQLGASTVSRGEEGYNVRAGANIPVSDSLAVRVSGFTRRDPGYIDNVAAGVDDVNRTDVEGGRLSAMWNLTEDFSIKASALYQHSSLPGPFFSMPSISGSDDFATNGMLNGDFYKNNAQVYSLIMSAKLGGLDLVSLSGYNINKVTSGLDATPGQLTPVSSVFPGTDGVRLINNTRTHKFTQEVRLSGTLGQRADWLVGGFYTEEQTSTLGGFWAADHATGELESGAFEGHGKNSFDEYAGFGNLVYHFTDRFELQLGARQSYNHQTNDLTNVGPLVPVFRGGFPAPLITPHVVSNDSSITYLVAPKFAFSPNFMVYGRVATGYGAGGPNAQRSPVTVFPDYGAQTTRSYEIGTKGSFRDQKVSIDASVYRIDWSDMQVRAFSPILRAPILFNASSAKSQGVELTVDVKPLRGLTVSGWVTYTDAKLTSSLPPGGVPAVAGEKLPLSSEFSGNLLVDQRFAVGGRWNAFAGVMVGYVGERVGAFAFAPPRTTLPSYVKTDLRTGIMDDSWQVNLFLNNVTNRRGELNSQLTAPPALVYIQPRTVGLSVSKDF